MARTRQAGPRVGRRTTIYSVAPGLNRGPAFLLLVDRDNGAMEKGGWVYILADRYRGGMYVGVTADIVRRVQQHRQGTGSEHVAHYGMTRPDPEPTTFAHAYRTGAPAGGVGTLAQAQGPALHAPPT